MSIDVNALNTAIYTALNVSSITDEVTGVYHFKAPQGTVYPYVNYWVVIDIQGDTFTEWGNDALVQIDVYSDSNSAAEAGNIVELIAAQMDDKVLTISGYDNNSKAIRQNSRLLFEDENNIFHYILEYSIRWHVSM